MYFIILIDFICLVQLKDHEAVEGRLKEVLNDVEKRQKKLLNYEQEVSLDFMLLWPKIILRFLRFPSRLNLWSRSCMYEYISPTDRSTSQKIKFFLA